MTTELKAAGVCGVAVAGDSDLLFSVVCVPFIAYHYAADNWMIGSVTCQLSQYLTYVTTYVTAYTLVAVAIVRVCKVTSTADSSRDERHHQVAAAAAVARGCCYGGVRLISLVVAALWTVVLIANVPVIFSYRIKTVMPSFNSSDTEPYKYCGWSQDVCTSTAVNTSVYVQVLRLVQRRVYKYCGQYKRIRTSTAAGPKTCVQVLRSVQAYTYKYCGWSQDVCASTAVSTSVYVQVMRLAPRRVYKYCGQYKRTYKYCG